MLVARAAPGEPLTKLGSHREVLRLGAEVQQHGRLRADAFERALDAVGRMVSVARAGLAQRFIAAGTSALRDASNGREFCDAVQARYGLRVELLSGDEEARLVFRGACHSFTGTAGRKAVIDVGGGSVELAVGEGDRVEHVESLELGFLRLAQQLASEAARVSPALKGALATSVAARVFAESSRAAERLSSFRPETWLFSGGSARAVGKFMGAGTSAVSAAELRRVAQELAEMSAERLVERGVDLARSETLGLGVAVMSALVRRLGIPTLHIAAGGLREGLIDRVLAELPAERRAVRISA